MAEENISDHLALLQLSFSLPLLKYEIYIINDYHGKFPVSLVY